MKASPRTWSRALSGLEFPPTGIPGYATCASDTEGGATMPRFSTWSAAADVDDAPPPFQWQGKLVVPVEFSRYELSLDLDMATKSGIGRARIDFSAALAGSPLLDMVPAARRIEVDGHSIPVSGFPEVAPPDNQTPVRVLDVTLPPGPHQLLIEYDLGSDTVSFDNGGVQLALFMSDLNERGYLERHAPSNLEFNQFPLTLNVSLAGASTPKLFTNGNATASGNSWKVSFPSHFSTSSFFFHLSDRPFHVQDDTFVGKEAQIPLTAYGLQQVDLPKAIATAKAVLAELEGTYGAYAHSRLTMYVTGDLGGGGMEYCGATMTSLRALPHEVLHSWFARGVMPANGNAGWVDEGIARWRDFQYPTRQPDPDREPTQLAGFSPYRRHTPRNAYTDGSMLFSELDHMFKQGGNGLRPVLAALYQRKKLQQITTEYLKSFLEDQTGRDLAPMFDRFVYGRAELDVLSPEAALQRRAASDAIIQEYEASAPPLPRGFTREELNALR
ncbi:MAG: hypothetical protein WCE79_06510 [Xanthobacteraceae bacterium]